VRPPASLAVTLAGVRASARAVTLTAAHFA